MKPSISSPFIQRIMQRYGDQFALSLEQPLPSEALLKVEIGTEVDQATTLAELKKGLRQQRNLQLARIAYHDLAGLASTSRVLKGTSDLADVLISAAYQWLYENFVQRYGQPIGAETGQAQQLIILGMGKLGGRELNFSSDIDLIFVYPEAGQTQGAVSICNELFFTRLAQAFNQVMTELTEEGFVYRVDMRLRPFGQTGPLVLSSSALEIYYQRHGRAWERYAALKARALTGHASAVDQLFRQVIVPFVYRRYTDFTAIEAIRELKRLIRLDVQKKGREQNIKLGEGGIREAEFVVQAFQLVYGGRIPSLQTQSFMAALQEVVVQGFMDSDAAAAFKEAYLYLRRVENHLQAWEDQQTQILPQAAEVQQYLAESMDQPNYEAFLVELGLHRGVIQQQFAQVFADSEQDQDAVTSAHNAVKMTLAQLFDQPDSDMSDEDFAALTEELVTLLGLKPELCQQILQSLQQFRQGRAFKYASAEAVQRLKLILEAVLQAVAAQDAVLKTLDRVLLVLEAILQRSIYLVLLQENPQAIQNLVAVCAASPWLTQQLVQTPALLDQLIEAETLSQLSEPQVLMKEALQIAQEATHLEAASPYLDEEFFMNQIRIWKHRQVFKVAVADIEQVLPVMQVSDYLTWIAEAALAACVRFASDWMALRSGKPGGLPQPDFQPFMVIGYGKLGGIELGYGSDLDIVMLYHGVDPSAYSDGKQPLENNLYFLRLGQKLISLMTTLMPSGKLYEVDTRLRPNGGSGLMVTDFASYQAYIERKAWVWEHQALVRARPVWGGSDNYQAFVDFRQGFLQKTRDAERIRQEVVGMLQKMRKALDKSDSQQMDLKYALGGIVEIEFLVQYLVLIHAHAYPKLTAWTDNIRLLQTLAEVLTKSSPALSRRLFETLMEAYQAYRACYHRLALQNEKAILPKAVFAQQAQAVHQVWQQLMEPKA